MSIVTIREARKHEADAIADMFTRSRALLSFLPKLHSLEEDKAFIEQVVMKEKTVLVATQSDRPCGFVAFDSEWIDHLYIDPNHTGKGMGSALLQAVKDAAPRLRLWTFQKNEGARRFYERHGFTIEAMTDGLDNEEKEPDILYVWSDVTTT